MPGRWSILALLLCLTLAGGCSRREAKLTFAVGGTPDELQVWEAIIADFQRQSGLQVELQRQPTDSDQRRQLLVIPLAAHQPDPDVFLMDVVWLAQFAASGWLLPLDEQLRRAGLDEDLFFSRVMELVDHYRGRLVALPVYVDGGLLYYRRDLLARYGFAGPPATWEELLAQAKRVQAGERSKQPRFFGFVWQGAQYEGLICNFLEFAASNRGGIIGKTGALAIDSPANRQALQFMAELIHRYRVSPPNTYSSMREEECREYFPGGAGPVRAQLAVCLGAAAECRLAGGGAGGNRAASALPRRSIDRRPRWLAGRNLPLFRCAGGGLATGGVSCLLCGAAAPGLGIGVESGPA